MFPKGHIFDIFKASWGSSVNDIVKITFCLNPLRKMRPNARCARKCGAHLFILSHELAAERKVPRNRGAPFYLGQQSELVGIKFTGYFACSSLC